VCRVEGVCVCLCECVAGCVCVVSPFSCLLIITLDFVRAQLTI
jgi:hypothetical protein